MLGSIRKADIVLGVGLLLLGGVLFAIILFSGEAGGEVEIARGGKVIGVYQLSQDQNLDIGENDAFNRLQIKDGKVKMLEANCPDQYCVRHQAIYRTDESIICLPNKVVVTIKKGEEQKLDAITN